MRLKKTICKNDYYLNGLKFFDKDKEYYYTIYNSNSSKKVYKMFYEIFEPRPSMLDQNHSWINFYDIENSNQGISKRQLFKNVFYTEQEIRKIKLEKIDEGNLY